MVVTARTAQQSASLRPVLGVEQEASGSQVFIFKVLSKAVLALMPVMAQQVSSESGGVSKKSAGRSTLAGKSR